LDWKSVLHMKMGSHEKDGDGCEHRYSIMKRVHTHGCHQSLMLVHLFVVPYLVVCIRAS